MNMSGRSLITYDSIVLDDGLGLLSQLEGVSKTAIINRALAKELVANEQRLSPHAERHFSERCQALLEFLSQAKGRAEDIEEVAA